MDCDLGTEASTAELEMRRWLDSLSYVYEYPGPERVYPLFDPLFDHVR